eukprot:4730544-Pleurochrysis_carterae.AAC.1
MFPKQSQQKGLHCHHQFSLQAYTCDTYSLCLRLRLIFLQVELAGGDLRCSQRVGIYHLHANEHAEAASNHLL